MRIKGQKVEGLNVEDIFIPRGEDIIHFRARAVADYSVCDAACPRPRARRGRDKSGTLIELTQEPNYVKALDDYANRRVAFMVIKSLEATEEFEWDTVNINDVNTWQNWRKEFEDAGFTDPEIARIFNGVMAACGLDEAKVQKARDRFLAGQREELELQSFQKDELNSTRSGELAPDSE